MSAATWHDRSLTLRDGPRLAWRVRAEESEDTLLYCHGFPGSRFEAHALLAGALGGGVRVLAPERPAYGGSDPRPGRRVLDWAEDIGELLAHLGVERLRVLGFSGGGPYALACAAVLGPRVERVGLVAAMGPVTDPRFAECVPEATRSLLDLARQAPEAFRAQIEWLAPDARALFRLMLDGLARVDIEVMSRPERQRDYEQSLAAALTQGVQGISEDAQALGAPWGFDLHEVRCPVDIWHGQQDRKVFPLTATRLAPALPSGRHTLLAEAGHFPSADRWASVVERLMSPLLP